MRKRSSFTVEALAIVAPPLTVDDEFLPGVPSAQQVYCLPHRVDFGIPHASLDQRNQNLAGNGTLGDPAHRRSRILEGVDAVYSRPDRTARVELDQFSEILRNLITLMFEKLLVVHPDECAFLEQRKIRRVSRDFAAGKTNHQNARITGNTARGLSEQVPSNRINDDVDALVEA
jgi:hypothetical protein